MLKRFAAHPLTWILLFAAAIRLIWFFTVIHYNPNGIWTSDSSEYWQLAKNLWEHGVYSQSKDAPFLPENLRTPLYPLFIAGIMALGGNGYVLIIFQILISAFTCFVVYKLTGLFSENRKVAIISSSIMAADIPSIVFSTFALTETLFCLLFTLSFYYFVHYFKTTNRLRSLIYSGIFLALSMLCRPVSQYVPIIFVVILIGYHREYLRATFKPLIVFTLVLAIIIAPWLIRNYQNFGKVFFTYSGDFTLAAWHAPNAYAQKNNITTGEARFKLWTDWYYAYPGDPYTESIKYYEYIGDKSREVLKDAPYYTIKQHALGVIGLLFKPVRGDFDLQLGKIGHEKIKPLSGIPLQESVIHLKNSTSTFSLVMILLQFALMLIVYAGFLFGCIYLFKERKYFYLILLGLIIFYFINMVVPPVTYSRFRVPVMPFIAVVSAFGIYYLMAKFKAKKALN